MGGGLDHDCIRFSALAAHQRAWKHSQHSDYAVAGTVAASVIVATS